MGELELYKKMVRENISLFDEYDVSHIITACPTCRYGLYEMGEKQIGERSKAETTDILVYLREVADIDIKISGKKGSTIPLPLPA